ncbi:MAG: cobyric acid synthase [Armatimonadetes bacterium]|nr:cobyric acid synthase [Armatimonadota bacterium]
MRAQTLMVQGTASHVGKSVIVAALCRALARRGLRVAPFKAQNMSLNSAVTPDGGEIGRSQAFQAEACGILPEVAMNPILLKPMAGGRCQVVVRGQPYATVEGYGDARRASLALAVIAECLAELRSRFDIVLLEGMGSPAEINLRGRDLANMRTAALTGAPVLLVGDIERGGVFAALAGTMALLDPEDRRRVAGFLINKYHGDPAVLAPGIAALARRYATPTLGVLPYLPDLRVAEEDAVALDTVTSSRATGIDIAVPRLPGIANFTDLMPLAAEPGVSVRYITSLAEWGSPALVILPGTRNTVADLAWLRECGLARRVLEHAAGGGWVVGLCGGYQMLGREIRDPHHVESARVPTQSGGLGLLDVATTFAEEKQLCQVRGISLTPGLEGLPVWGYEIHHGVTTLGPGARPAIRLTERWGVAVDETEGAVAAGGAVFGTYLHGIFDAPGFRQPFLRRLGWVGAGGAAPANVFDRLADWLEAHVEMDRLLALVGIT